ncbi:hypothetical protein NHH03_12045 [Stieleria sp. TO1_6]|uniref:hypothetical protein n=1 Tax=Stieleria tagensis TaxID=2956795 RepID=UPI00209B0ABB|nr:hypothetical protein [Stieleria tagensis]MCO8122470.1 hypothetical protein [Stieleria tagensis]
MQLNSFFSKPKGFLLPQHPLSQAGAATSHPQAGAAISQPQAGSAISQPQAGSAQQLSQPCFLPNSFDRNPPQHPLGALSHPQGSAISQPQAGSIAHGDAISQPQAGSAHPVSQPVLQSLLNRPNALAFEEVLATKATANKAGTITRRIVILH